MNVERSFANTGNVIGHVGFGEVIILKRVAQLALVVIISVIIIFIGIILLNMRYKAVYLTPANGGQLSYQDLRNHPEVKVVHNGYQLIISTVGNKAIWIDKDRVESINTNVLVKTWLNVNPVKYHPMVLVGYNNVFILSEIIGASVTSLDRMWIGKRCDLNQVSVFGSWL